MSTKGKVFLISAIVIILLLAGGAGYFFFGTGKKSASATETSAAVDPAESSRQTAIAERQKKDKTYQKSIKLLAEADLTAPTLDIAIAAAYTNDAYILNTIHANGFSQWDHPMIIISAAAYGSEGLLLLLIEYGASLNATADGWSLLHQAVSYENTEFIDALLARNFDINIKDKNDNTPLHVAALKNINITKYLLDKGADINAVNNHGLTPLFGAVEDNNNIAEILNLTAWVNSTPRQDQDNKSIKEIIKKNNELNALLQKNMELIQLLISKGADINHKTNSGTTALHFATQKKNTALVKFLVDNGANINLPDADGYTVLHYAVHQKNTALVKFLVGKGADINIRSKKNQSAIYLAALNDQMDVVLFLLEKGAEIDQKSAYMLLPAAAKDGNLALTKSLLEQNLNVNHKNANGNTALHNAAAAGKLEMVKFLVSRGANIKIRNNYGETPLDIAGNSAVKNYLKSLRRR